MGIESRIERLEDRFKPKKKSLPPFSSIYTTEMPQEAIEIIEKLRKIEKDSGWRRTPEYVINTVGEYSEACIKRLEKRLEVLRKELKEEIKEYRFQEIEVDIADLRRKYEGGFFKEG